MWVPYGRAALPSAASVASNSAPLIRPPNLPKDLGTPKLLENGEHGEHCKPTPEYKPICSLPPSVTSDGGEEHNLKDNGNDYQRFKHTSIFLLLSLDGQPITGVKDLSSLANSPVSRITRQVAASTEITD